MSGYVETARKSWPENLAATNDVPVDGPLVEMLQVGWQHALSSFGRFLTAARCARVGVLLERYRLAHGTVPESLTALTPKFTAQLPIDPFSGDPLILQLEKQRYTIYGVGPNQQDNGGIVECDGNGEAVDIGFRVRLRGDN